MVSVPSQYQGLINSAAQATGLPVAVVAAQVNMESGFNPGAVSPAGAEGMFQFMPGTLATTGGGNPFDPNSEVKNYDTYMKQLLQQEGGSVFKALEAYNAGPGNLQAGAGYANSILSAAGTGVNITAGGGGGSTPSGTANLTGSGASSAPFPGGSLDPLNWPWEIGSSVSQEIVTATTSLGEAFLQAIGITSVKDLLIRAGLIILGFVIVIVGLLKLLDVGQVAATASNVAGGRVVDATRTGPRMLK